MKQTILTTLKNNLKMGKITLAVFAFALTINANAQDVNEMLENGSFEQLEGKIKRAGAIEVSIGWMSPTKKSADLYSERVKELYSVPNNVMGKEDGHDGETYAGITTFSYGDKLPRSYVSSKLKMPMRKGLKYAVKFYVSLAEGSKYASNNIGANFSKKQYNIQENKSILAETHILRPENPVFNAMFGWDQVCGVYTATGGEKFITIGNFSPTGSTKSEKFKKPKSFSGSQKVAAYYYIDNITVTLIEEASDCKCDSDKAEKDDVVYSVSPVNPEGMKDEQIVKYSVVYFGANKSKIELGSEGHLDNIAMVMKKDPEYKLTLYVHMDKNEVAEPQIENLDKLRAEEIKKYLVKKGVVGGRITFQLLKDTKPKTNLESEIGYAKNRRVNFSVSK